jgi:hypothetical protein
MLAILAGMLDVGLANQLVRALTDDTGRSDE